MIEIQEKPGDFQIDVKRFYLPFILQSKCPECGTEWKKDLSGNGLSYPVLEKPFEFFCYCVKCDHEWSAFLKLHVTLTPA